MPVKPPYRLYKRGKTFYAEHTLTKTQESLRDKDRTEAERLLAAKNAGDNSHARHAHDSRSL